MRQLEFSGSMSVGGDQFAVDCDTHDERLLLMKFLDGNEYGLTPQDREDIGNAAYQVLISRLREKSGAVEV